MFYSQANVSLPNDTDVVVKRSFKAPRELVWKAHTDPALMQRWMLGPPGWTMPVCEMDVRVGGKYRQRWRSDEDGKEFGFYGEFLEVNAPGKLAHKEYFDPGSVGGDMGTGTNIISEFVEENGVTTLIATMRFASKAEREAAMSTGMTDGMEQSYKLLDQLLVQK